MTDRLDNYTTRKKYLVLNRYTVKPLVILTVLNCTPFRNVSSLKENDNRGSFIVF